MAKGDICKVDGCERIVTQARGTLCNIHLWRWNKYKSFGDPVDYTIVAICKIHGELIKNDCLKTRKIKKLASGLNGNYNLWRCKKCRKDALKAWKIRNPEIVKERDKNKHLVKRYRLTLDQYNKMLLEQNNKCAICNKEESAIDIRGTGNKRLAVDHCHKTNKIRKLLCYKCNTSLGGFEDSIKNLKSAIKYLKAHQE